METLGDRYYGNQMESMQNAKTVGPLTMKQRLEMAVRDAEQKLAAAKRAREIFEKNPDLEEFLNIMQRNHF